VAYFPFNGSANDVSGNGNNGTPTTPTLTVDRFGNADSAFNFKADVDSKITVPNSPSLQFDSQFTISLWVKFNQPWSGHVEDLAWKASGTFSSYTGWEVAVNQDNGVNYLLFGVLNPGNVQNDSYIFGDFGGAWLGHWRNIVAVQSNGISLLYLDGNLVATENNGGLSTASPAEFIIGGSIHPVSGAYNRDIDDVRLYNRALSAAEVASLHSYESGPHLAIEVRKVKVTMSVFVGGKYQLFSSLDLKTWSPVGDPFVAQTPTLTQEFDVMEAGQYFSIQLVP
jgi:hypothetical protein